MKLSEIKLSSVRLPVPGRGQKGSVVGLELDTAGLAATEVVHNGTARVRTAAIAPVPGGSVQDGEVIDPEALGEALSEMFAANSLSADVRLGLANQKIAVRTIRLPVIADREELETAIRFRAADEIPMPLDQAVMDYTVLGEVGPSTERRLEVVVAAARRDMVSTALAALRAAGLRPTGIDLSAYGLIRGLHGAVPAPAAAAPAYEDRQELGGAAYPSQPARLYCNLGELTNLAIARGEGCLFTRAATFGIEGIAQRLAESSTLTLDHARAWLTHVGLTAAVGEIDGDREIIGLTRAALEEGVAKIADELRLSLEFYGQQDGVPPVADVVLTGAGAEIPGMADRLAGAFMLPVTSASAAALADRFGDDASRLTLSYGLALEGTGP